MSHCIEAQAAVELERVGVVVRFNFWPDFADLRSEADNLCEVVRPFIDQIDNPLGDYRVWKLRDIELSSFPNLGRLIHDPSIKALLEHAAGRSIPEWQYDPVIQWTRTIPNAYDDNCDMHSDYFTHTAKGFLYLHDVAEDEGPLEYCVGSHLLTKERIEFEETSFKAGDNESLRVTNDRLQALGIIANRTRICAFPANTLMIADTFGFHRRRPPEKSIFRKIIYFAGGGKRPNPFFG